MERSYIEDAVFEKINFTEKPLAEAGYDNCTFRHCDFSTVDLSNIHFSDCTFMGCNLSMVTLNETHLQDVEFKDCKLLGVHFEQCNEFLLGISIDNCLLNLASFFRLKLKKMRFKNSSLHEVDFTDADLSDAVFDNCDLSRAVFEKTNLEKADFRTAYNYSIDPERNRVKKAKFSLQGVVGLLDKYDIHID